MLLLKGRISVFASVLYMMTLFCTTRMEKTRNFWFFFELAHQGYESYTWHNFVGIFLCHKTLKEIYSEPQLQIYPNTKSTLCPLHVLFFKTYFNFMFPLDGIKLLVLFLRPWCVELYWAEGRNKEAIKGQSFLLLFYLALPVNNGFNAFHNFIETF